MENYCFLRREYPPQPYIRCCIEPFQEPHRKLGLVQHFNAEQCGIPAVSAGHTVKHRQGKRNILVRCMPGDHTNLSAVVKTVLASRNGMEVKQDLQPITVSPGKSFIHIAGTPDIGRAAAEKEKGHGKPHCVYTFCSETGKIFFRNIRIPVGFQPARKFIMRKVPGKGILIFCPACISKDGRGHPFFKDKPVAQIDAADTCRNPVLPVIHTNRVCAGTDHNKNGS